MEETRFDPKIERLKIRMPLIQQLTKYAFFLLVLFLFASRIINVLDATEERLALGGEFSIGPTGLKLGQAPKIPDTKLSTVTVEELSVPESPVSEAQTKGGGSFYGLTDFGAAGGGNTSIEQPHPPIHDPLEQRPLELPEKTRKDARAEMFYIIHGAKKIKAGEYAVKIRLGAHNEKTLSSVDRVVYILHETFKDRRREVTDKDSRFELNITAWGQFEIKAEVFLNNQESPIKLRRFLNF
ncbi:MAG: hypothetical protein GF334_07035 [Candidatus Altiarchaeales archaeon]|nr:hypothetical protein [Candidatus Altiarchaeales archaeon]